MGESRLRTLSTRFTAAYGITHPIAAAGMAFVTLTPTLPVAVSRAGALGAFAAGILPLPEIRNQLRSIRAQVQAPLHLNLITPFATEAHIDLCVGEGVNIVSFHWGHPPAGWRSRLRSGGIRIWEQVGSEEEARRAVDEGADLLIAQGMEAGGHCRSRLPTFVCTPAIVDAAQGTLVLAAGGIVDGRGLAAALALGADGAWIGTRFVASTEADVAPEYKAALVRAGAGDTVLTSRYGRDRPTFNPMRVLRNRLVAEDGGGAVEDAAPEDGSVIGHTVIAGQAIPLKRFASLVPVTGTTGDFGQMALPAGQGVGAVRDIPPARKIIERMVEEAAEILQRLSEFPGQVNHAA